MTRAFRRRASIRLAWRGNIAVNSANKTIVKLRFRSRLPTGMEAFPLPIGFICQRNGPAMRSEGAGRRARRCDVSNQAPNRFGANRQGPERRRSAGGGADGCWLWRQHGVARWDNSIGTELRRGYPAADIGLEGGRRPLAAQALQR